MEKKTAVIIMYLIDVLCPPLAFVGFLIALLVGKKEVVGGKNLTQGAILAILGLAGILAAGIGPVITFVFGIIALVKIFKDGDLDPELPLIGGLNWFDK